MCHSRVVKTSAPEHVDVYSELLFFFSRSHLDLIKILYRTLHHVVIVVRLIMFNGPIRCHIV